MRQNQPSRWWRSKWTHAAAAGTALVLLACSCGSDFVAYDLPAESARYTFEADMDGVHTEWEYTSGRPAEDTAPEARPCLGEMFGLDATPQPCRPEPLIFLQYDLELGLDNTLPANRAETVQITGYYQQLDNPPTVTELTLEVSLDGGDTWQQVPTSASADSTFRATIAHPALSAEAGDVVSLRVNATDDQGNTVTQTIPHAYGLS